MIVLLVAVRVLGRLRHALDRRAGGGCDALTIDVIGAPVVLGGRATPARASVTANEIHIPVGTPVDVVGTTADVIHSFWVPELNRKIDLIPGRTNRVLLEADRPGRTAASAPSSAASQHAHMAVAS